MTTTIAAPGTAPELYNHFTCRGCNGTRPLTLGDRELITRRSILTFDDETGIPYCGDCLADLPHGPEALAHICGEESQVQAAPEPAVTVIHKTRTTPPAGYVQDETGCRRFDKRGRVMHNKSSFALCSCGWRSAGATREEARWRARAHREEMAEAA